MQHHEKDLTKQKAQQQVEATCATDKGKDAALKKALIANLKNKMKEKYFEMLIQKLKDQAD